MRACVFIVCARARACVCVRLAMQLCTDIVGAIRLDDPVVKVTTSDTLTVESLYRIFGPHFGASAAYCKVRAARQMERDGKRSCVAAW